MDGFQYMYSFAIVIMALYALGVVSSMCWPPLHVVICLLDEHEPNGRMAGYRPTATD